MRDNKRDSRDARGWEVDQVPDDTEKRTKVLAVDDDPDIRGMISVALSARGFDVVTAGGGEEGLEIARIEKPDIIVLDVEMPGMKGPEVCKALTADPGTCGIPIIFLTGKVDLDAMEETFEGGAQAYIMKPFSPFVLLDKIEEVLGVEGE